jgi:hypothetical protein
LNFEPSQMEKLIPYRRSLQPETVFRLSSTTCT